MAQCSSMGNEVIMDDFRDFALSGCADGGVPFIQGERLEVSLEYIKFEISKWLHKVIADQWVGAQETVLTEVINMFFIFARGENI